MSARIKKIQFLSEGFADILKGPGVSSAVQAQARIQKAALEASEGVPYVIEQMAGATSRTVYNVRPEIGRETLKREAWEHFDRYRR